MKRKGLALILALTVTIVMCFTGCGDKGINIDSDLSMAADVEKYVDAIDIEYAYNLTEKLAYDEDYWDCELGWRTAGSDAEHRCADFLAEEMKNIGLTDIEKIPTKVDKFQFNDSSFTIEGTEIDLMPAAYQCTGTDKDGITAEIVNVGTGFEADYDDIDVEGKIVIAKVDQANESWIDGYIRQAHDKGAAALVSYANSGYGELNEDTANVQDICCEDLTFSKPVKRATTRQLLWLTLSLNRMKEHPTMWLDISKANPQTSRLYCLVTTTNTGTDSRMTALQSVWTSPLPRL